LAAKSGSCCVRRTSASQPRLSTAGGFRWLAAFRFRFFCFEVDVCGVAAAAPDSGEGISRLFWVAAGQFVVEGCPNGKASPAAGAGADGGWTALACKRCAVSLWATTRETSAVLLANTNPVASYLCFLW
jgi:hypothetical protein